ncbi:hypothetical protein HDR61_03235 [bacterium]|nr:hypothetical protein [bacterium]
MSKNALITLWYVNGLHGGVKYSAELGNYLHSMGYSVYLCGVVTDDAAREFFAANNVKMYNVADFPTDIEFDLVWAHHWPILPYLIRRGLQYKRVINSCISHFLLVERPIWFRKNIDMYLTLTSQTKLLFTQKYNIPAGQIEILPNTAPDAFFEYNRNPHDNTLHKVAVVTNHPPQEIWDAIEILRGRGIDVVMYGNATKPVDITPQILAQYDAVVTIGKTVQYALAMGIPVYNYDYFGGSGYITPENIDEEQAHNFSGRSHFTKKTGTEIADEIMKDFATVQQYQSQLQSIATDRYKLSTRINAVLKKLYAKKPVRHIRVNNNNRLLFDYCEMIVDQSASDNGIARHVSVPNFAPIKPRPRGLRRLWRHMFGAGKSTK